MVANWVVSSLFGCVYENEGMPENYRFMMVMNTKQKRSKSTVLNSVQYIVSQVYTLSIIFFVCEHQLCSTYSIVPYSR
jgi:hypothetical protein